VRLEFRPAKRQTAAVATGDQWLLRGTDSPNLRMARPKFAVQLSAIYDSLTFLSPLEAQGLAKANTNFALPQPLNERSSGINVALVPTRNETKFQSRSTQVIGTRNAGASVLTSANSDSARRGSESKLPVGSLIELANLGTCTTQTEVQADLGGPLDGSETGLGPDIGRSTNCPVATSS